MQLDLFSLDLDELAVLAYDRQELQLEAGAVDIAATFDIAEVLAVARQRIPSNNRFGEWVKGAGIGYSTQWRSTLIAAGNCSLQHGRPVIKLLDNGFSFERYAKGQHPTTGGSGEDQWFTPPWVFEHMGLVFDLDVAAPEGGVSWVPARNYYTQADNGLEQPWHGTIWCNPPYSSPTEWCRRFAEHPDGAILIRADLSTSGPFAAFVEADAIWIPEKRLQFVAGNQQETKQVTFSTIMLGRGAVVPAMQALAEHNGATRVLS